MLNEGDRFPNFSLPDQDGKLISLGDLLGTPTVVYFYPKDDTSGCTVEACEFRDAVASATGVKVIGVSPDGSKSHQKFIRKYGLNFTLLSDETHALSEAVGVWAEKSMYGKTYMGILRSTFMLDENGIVTRAFHKVRPAGHAQEVMRAR